MNFSGDSAIVKYSIRSIRAKCLRFTYRMSFDNCIGFWVANMLAVAVIRRQLILKLILAHIFCRWWAENCKNVVPSGLQLQVIEVRQFAPMESLL